MEIQDTLQENVDKAIEDVKDFIIEHIKDNEIPKDAEADEIDVQDLDNDGSITQITDHHSPDNTKEIKDTWYHKLEKAYHDRGLGEDSRTGNGATAIWVYIEQEVHEWMNDEDNIKELILKHGIHTELTAIKEVLEDE